MDTPAETQRLERIEKFLDNIDKVSAPSDLQEPFRSLWLRMHGERPTMMSEDRKEAFLSGGFSGTIMGDVDISSAQRSGQKSSIEVISPSEVGPTVEMMVDEKKVTFKMADPRTLKDLQAKESAANQMIELQNTIKSLSGLGGEVARVWEGITDIARDYRNGQFDKAMDLGTILKNKIASDDFKRSVIVELQKKLAEYDEIGGATSDAKSRFKDLATSLKGGDKDFMSLAGEVNSLAEESIKDIVTEEVVAEVKAAPKPSEPEPTQKVLKRKVVPKLPRGEEEAEEDEMVLDEDEEEGPAEEEPAEVEAEEKPVIKIVTVKKLVPVKKVRKERKEYKEQLKKDEETPEPEAKKEDASDTKEPDVKKAQVEPAPQKVIKKEPEPEVRSEPAPAPNVEKKVAAKPEEKKREPAAAPPAGPSKEEIQSAFKKYQFVYNASVKLHEGGKDVSQIFDMMNYAEQVRQKGDMKVYIGVCKQMESMLIDLQTK